MIDLPVAIGFERSCIGYRGPEIALHTGRHQDAPVSGVLRAGDDIQYRFIPVDGWTFVDLDRGPAVRRGRGLKCLACVQGGGDRALVEVVEFAANRHALRE